MLTRNYFILLYCLIWLASCGSEYAQEQEEEIKGLENYDQLENNEKTIKYAVNQCFSVPSPFENVEYFSKSIPSFEYKTSVFDTANTSSKKYQFPFLGLVISDLAFTTEFNTTKDSSLLQAKCQTFKNILKDFNVKDTQCDSIQLFYADAISTEILSTDFTLFMNQLKGESKYEESAQVLMGSWTGVSYSLFESAGDFGNRPDLEKLILEQLNLYIHLNSMLKTFETEESNDFLIQFKEIEKTVDQLAYQLNDFEMENTTEGLVLKGGKSYEFTASSYVELKRKLKNLRNLILS